MEKLRISDNRRYFTDSAGRPFPWLADTVWTMPQRMRWDDVDRFMQERKKQGFTVLQICALDPERDEGMHDPAGNKALIGDDLSRPNEDYFRYLDRVLDCAEHYGFYVLLLPVWGQLVVGDDWSGNQYKIIATADNVYEYGCYIGSRYKDRSNILWCLGGDRQPVHNGVDYRDVWRKMAEGLAKGILGRDLKWNEADPDWEKLLITYHTNYEVETGACSTMCYWTDEEAWISYIMLQTGHSTGCRSWAWVSREYDREHTESTFTYSDDYQITWNVPVEKPMRRMPVWDGEPYYERGLSNCALTRHRAYWDMLAGSFGFTYGNWSVWSSVYQKEKVPGLMAETWFDALSSVGTGQMTYLRAFMEQMNIQTFIPCQALLGSMADGGAPAEPDEILYANHSDLPLNHVQAAVSMETGEICVYFPHDGAADLDLTVLPKKISTEAYYWWFNPRTGICCGNDGLPADKPEYAATPDGRLHVCIPNGDFRTASSDPMNTDWVLIVRTKETAAPVVVPESYWTENADAASVTGKEKDVFF